MGLLLENIKPWQRYAVIAFVIVLLIIGIILLSTCNEVQVKSTLLTEYSNCTDHQNTRCADGSTPSCICNINYELKEDLLGTVIFFYELVTYMQNNKSYITSRDNKQLAGVLSLTPSEDCGDFTYDITSEGRKPIAPCGAIADSMFTDSYSLIAKDDKFVPTISSGLLSEEDKKGFHNPPGDSLENAFKNFTKPKSWQFPVWDLDKVSSSNNGFENEAFIAWMRTDWKKKPVWRIDHSKDTYEKGLPKGSYTIQINYVYPASRYSGPRNLIAENEYKWFNLTKYVIGVVLTVVASTFLAAIIMYAIFVYFKSRYTPVSNS